jgi:hypothetical protein
MNWQGSKGVNSSVSSVLTIQDIGPAVPSGGSRIIFFWGGAGTGLAVGPEAFHTPRLRHAALKSITKAPFRHCTATHMQMCTKFALIYAKKLKIPATDNSDVLIAAAIYYFCISDDECSISVGRNATVY